MANTELQPLSLGGSDFSALRQWGQNGQIYVDKTAQVYELASKHEKFLLVRPRRFGKSLLISTFEALFRDGLSDFKGLTIENLWKEKSTYHVVRLDFSLVKNFTSIEYFSQRLASFLIRRFWDLGFRPTGNDVTQILCDFSKWFKGLPPNSLVLLIDEYDAPLTACLDEPDVFDAVKKKLSDFYSVINSNDLAIRFLFMTGITKFHDARIFSELKNLTDISLFPKFGTLLGFTKEEVGHYFKDYLAQSARILETEECVLLNELSSHYGGYCFEETAKQQVLGPWSLLNFLSNSDTRFGNYWVHSGGHIRMLLEYIKTPSIKEPTEYENKKEVLIEDLKATSNDSNKDDYVLLTQTGYLTIKDIEGEKVTLGYPNKEVAWSMAYMYVEMMLSRDALHKAGRRILATKLRNADALGFVEELNRIFQGYEYCKYPIHNEVSCRTAVNLLLWFSSLEPTVKQHNALGGCYLEVNAGDNHWVLAFKFAQELNTAERLCKEGMALLKDCGYGEEFEGKQILRRMVLVFAQEAKQFVCQSEELEN